MGDSCCNLAVAQCITAGMTARSCDYYMCLMMLRRLAAELESICSNLGVSGDSQSRWVVAIESDSLVVLLPND